MEEYWWNEQYGSHKLLTLLVYDRTLVMYTAASLHAYNGCSVLIPSIFELCMRSKYLVSASYEILSVKWNRKFSRRGLEITLTSCRWNMLFSTKLPLPLPQIHTIITLLMSHTVESWLPLSPWSTGYELCHWAEFMSGGTENMVNIWEPQLNSLGTIV